MVNAAGILEVANWEVTDLADWDRSMDINVRTVFGLTRHALPLLKESKGTVVNVSSSAQQENSRSMAMRIDYGDFSMWVGGDLTGGGNARGDRPRFQAQEGP